MDDKKKQPSRFDLGPVYVMQMGSRDAVYITHNDLLAFTVVCKLGKESRVKVMKEFAKYDMVQVTQVFNAYYKWKREQLPDFKLPNFSGRTKAGSPHPWRNPGFFHP